MKDAAGKPQAPLTVVPTAGPWLQPGGVLLHVGPPKTGTTALQTAQFAARRELAEQGFRYPVRKDRGRLVNQHGYAGAALMGRQRQGVDSVEPIAVWEALVRKVQRRDDRALLSSEFFAEFEPEHIARAIEDFGSEDLQVLITLRPLASLLASTWQQDLKGGQPQSFDQWLTERLEGSEDQVFWYRHAHDELVERWVSQLGADRVAVLGVDPSQPTELLRNFEQLTGITSGTLQPKRGNRSLTQPETELIREIYRLLDDEIDEQQFHLLVRWGGFTGLVERRDAPAAEQRIIAPDWAIRRASEIHGPMLDRIVELDVTRFGDFDALRIPPTPTDAKAIVGLRDEATSQVPVDAAAQLALGIYRAALRQQMANRPTDTGSAKPRSWWRRRSRSG
ncbi:MAG: hypothetical protein K0U60_06905 [Actinomycetia bacterium]|nr:hypothetical protein [Actinomycetes bacterium]MCH9800754.1 hypothetical protein [Actinomycetes bacterium]